MVGQAPSVNPVYRWDFKDGSKKEEGKSVSHAFSKPGTYIVQLEAKFPGKTEDFASVDTIQMTVLPTKVYQSPVARIKVNGKLVEDPLRDTISIKPVTPVSFDGSDSKGKIVKYQWDFGDDKGAEKQVTLHRYGRDEYFPVVALRVTDENNIASDTYALLDMPFQKSNPILSFFYTISDFISGLLYKE